MAAPAHPTDCRSPINSNSTPTFWLSSRAEPGNQHRRIFDAVARTASSLKRDRRFADSPLEERGFELVWGFSCQVVVFGLLPVLCSERERPFFVPSPAIRFPERAEGVKGPKR